MKKQLFAAVFAASVVFAVASPAMAQEQVLEVPKGAVAVGKTVMKELKTYDGLVCNPSTEGKKKSCPDLVKKMTNKVLLRNDKNGALYRLETVNVQRPWATHALKVDLVHYLPAGFYKVGKKYYWVADGKRMTLGTEKKLGTAHSRFVNRLRKDSKSVVSISDEEYLNVYGETLCQYDVVAINEECNPPTNEERSKKLVAYLGRIIIRNSVETGISSVHPDGIAPYTLTTKKQFAKNVPVLSVTNVSLRTMRDVPQYNVKNTIYVGRNSAFLLNEKQKAEYEGNSMSVTLNEITDEDTVNVTVHSLYSMDSVNLSLNTDEASTYDMGGDGGIGYTLELLSVNKKAEFIMHVTE